MCGSQPFWMELSYFSFTVVFAAAFNFTLSSVSHRFAEPCVVMAGVPCDHKTVLCTVSHPSTSVLLFCWQKSWHSHLQYVAFGKCWMISVLSYLIIGVSHYLHLPAFHFKYMSVSYVIVVFFCQTYFWDCTYNINIDCSDNGLCFNIVMNFSTGCIFAGPF